jgi:hypothetical protein
MISDDDFHALLDVSKKMLANGEELELILQVLRQNDCTMVDCIRIVIELKSLSLEEANSLVHYSKTWEDMRAYTERVHNAFIEGLAKLQDNLTS